MSKIKKEVPLKTFVKEWFSEGMIFTLFLWIYSDRINWRVDEDAPYKFTVTTETDQSLEDYYQKGPTLFVKDSFSETELLEIDRIIKEALENSAKNT